MVLSFVLPRRVPAPRVRRLQAVTNAIRWLPLAAALFGAAVPGAAAGQTARDRDPMVGPFRDSVAQRDPDQLRVVERSLMARVRRERTNPAIHLRLGILAFRLAEFSDAASEFKWTAQLAPQWGPAWLGLGQSELAMGETVDTSRAGRQALLAKDAWARASQAFSRALAADPGQIGNLEALVQERLAADRPAPAAVVRDGVRLAAAARTRTADVVLGLGRIERAMGDSAAALIAFDAAVALPGGRALGLFEGARIRLSQGDRRGLDLYLEAAGLDDSAAVAALREDVAWIGTGAELEHFDRLRGADRVRFLGEFWAGRDRNDLRQTGERIREHYRRLALAGRSFSNRNDQRFAVMVRQGEPDTKAAARLPGVPGNESWWYGRNEGDLVVHFISGADTTYSRVVESLFDLGGNRGAPAGDDRAAGEVGDQLLRSRAQLSPFYQAAAAGRRDQLGPFRVREREIGRASRNLALTTDRFPLRFGRDLPVRAQWLSLGSRPARPGTAFVFAVPSFAELESARSVRLRLVVWDSAGAAALALDTVLVAGRSDDRDGPRFLRGHLTTGLPAGRYSARVAIEVGAGGAVVTRDDLVVAPAGESLGELALGSARNGSSVAIGDRGEPIEVDPWGVYRRSDSLTVVALAVGAPGRAPIAPRVEVRPLRADGRVERWRTWPGLRRLEPVPAGGDGEVRISVPLPLRKLPAGAYEVGLEILDGRGQRVRRVGRFVVAEGAK